MNGDTTNSYSGLASSNWFMQDNLRHMNTRLLCYHEALGLQLAVSPSGLKRWRTIEHGWFGNPLWCFKILPFKWALFPSTFLAGKTSGAIQGDSSVIFG